jgi:hypothetical protein
MEVEQKAKTTLRQMANVKYTDIKRRVGCSAKHEIIFNCSRSLMG